MPPSRFPVSPGLASRPSLSELPCSIMPPSRFPVSPGFRSRPSLSEAELALRVDGLRVSPGLRSRPSLRGAFPISRNSV